MSLFRTSFKTDIIHLVEHDISLASAAKDEEGSIKHALEAIKNSWVEIIKSINSHDESDFSFSPAKTKLSTLITRISRAQNLWEDTQKLKKTNNKNLTHIARIGKDAAEFMKNLKEMISEDKIKSKVNLLKMVKDYASTSYREIEDSLKRELKFDEEILEQTG